MDEAEHRGAKQIQATDRDARLDQVRAFAHVLREVDRGEAESRLTSRKIKFRSINSDASMLTCTTVKSPTRCPRAA